MEIRIKKLRNNAHLPTRGSEFSAGADLYACFEEKTEGVVINPGETVMVNTGLAFEIPEGYVGLVYARSGLASKRGLAPANKVGVVDSDYRGEVMIALHNHSNRPQPVINGERIAQIVFTTYLAADFVEVDELSDTERGEGGFGSTGEK